VAGFFGKLPLSGDFLARGLAPGQRAWLDGWITRWVAQHARQPDQWPPGGLRGLLDTPDGPLLVVIGPSVDLPGRSFPILACTAAAGVSQDTADRWADLAAVALSRAVQTEYDADTLFAALSSIPSPVPDEPSIVPPVLWSDDAIGPPEDIVPSLFGAVPPSSG
jgi:type VI secretion system protein ImpM